MVATIDRLTGVSNDLAYVKGLKVGPGSLTVTVKDLVDGTVKTISHSYNLNVVGPTKVVVAPANFWVLQGGGTTQLTATPYDRSGHAIAGRAATWQSSSWSIAEISAAGVVTGRVPGSVTITGTVDGVSGTTTGTVRPSSCTDCTNPWQPSEPPVW